MKLRVGQASRLPRPRTRETAGAPHAGWCCLYWCSSGEVKSGFPAWRAVVHWSSVVGQRIQPQPPQPLNPQPSTSSNGAFSPFWSGQNPTGGGEIPEGRLTQELAACA